MLLADILNIFNDRNVIMFVPDVLKRDHVFQDR